MLLDSSKVRLSMADLADYLDERRMLEGTEMGGGWIGVEALPLPMYKALGIRSGQKML
jgi:hypothetical protein